MLKFNSLLTITEGSQGSNMADYVLIALLKKIYDTSYISTLTLQTLTVNLGVHASTEYANWKSGWNKDSNGLTLWNDDNTYPIYLFTDEDMLNSDNILKRRFIEYFKNQGRNIEIFDLLGHIYDV